jgi:hypothetical protein
MNIDVFKNKIFLKSKNNFHATNMTKKKKERFDKITSGRNLYDVHANHTITLH